MLKFLNFFSKKDIKYASVGSVFIKFGSAFFAFLNGVLLARFLTIEDFGYYVLAFSTIMILLVPSSLGLPNLITRYISKYEVHNNLSAIKGILISTNKFVTISTLLIYGIAAITYILWWKQYDKTLVETLLYSFLLLPFIGFSSLKTAALRGMKLIILSELPDTLFRNFAFTVAILVCLLIDITLTPQLAILLQVLAAAFGFLLGYFFLREKLLKNIKNVKPVFFDKEWIKETIPFSINSGVQVAKSKLLTFVLVLFGSIEAVAIFDIAMRGATLVSFTLDALNKAISPFVSSAFEKGNTKYLQRIVTKTSRIIFVCSLPVALVFIFGGMPLLKFIFGEDYTQSYIPLLILCIGQLVNAAVGSVGLLLNMTGNQRFFSKNNLIMMVLSILLSIPFIIFFDTVGAAIAYSSVVILQNISLLFYVRKKLNINTSIF